MVKILNIFQPNLNFYYISDKLIYKEGFNMLITKYYINKNDIIIKLCNIYQEYKWY